MWDLQMQAIYHPELFREVIDVEANIAEKFALCGVKCRVVYDREAKSINVYPEVPIEEITLKFDA